MAEHGIHGTKINDVAYVQRQHKAHNPEVSEAMQPGSVIIEDVSHKVEGVNIAMK